MNWGLQWVKDMLGDDFESLSKKKPKRREVGIFFNIFTTTKRKVMNFHFILDSCSLFDNMSHLKK